MEELQGIPGRPYIYNVLDSTSDETASDTYDQYIGAELEISDTKVEMIMSVVKKL